MALADQYKALSESLQAEEHFTPVGAGFIGFAVTLVVGLLILGGESAPSPAKFGE